ncbi:MAG: hypothetical protein IJY38_02145 [Clostridia bacterium]|nr:hypothetical protein [Clostridia bacterium]
MLLACGFDNGIADGMIRISFSPLTTKDEIVEGANILNTVAQGLKNKMK